MLCRKANFPSDKNAVRFFKKEAWINRRIGFRTLNLLCEVYSDRSTHCAHLFQLVDTLNGVEIPACRQLG